MDLEANIMNDIQELAQENMRFVGETYGDLAKGATRNKIIPIYRRFDSLANASATTIDCEAGCDFCCHYHVYVTPLEVFAIAELVRTLPTSRQRDIIMALRAYVETVCDWGQERHVRTNIACAFLKDHACSIYESRPLACRRHHSATRSVCESTFHDPHSDEMVTQDMRRVAVSAALEHVHAQYHTFRKFDHDSYEFHAAVLEALTDNACRQRWNAGKQAFLIVSDRQAAGA